MIPCRNGEEEHTGKTLIQFNNQIKSLSVFIIKFV